jgi:hypothetical protein
MSEEFKALVDASYNNGMPIWLYTSDYIYGLVPADPNGDRWIEVSYTFDDPDEPLVKTERNADLSYQFLIEEVFKGVTFYIEDLNVNKLKEFTKTLESKSGPKKMNALIAELVNNSGGYSVNLPIIKNKAGLQTLKDKV